MSANICFNSSRITSAFPSAGRNEHQFSASNATHPHKVYEIERVRSIDE
ncbi:hypothetical protein [Chamaesiphon minutus]|nr:hypothetical protein [Chamaesiphon minutus]